MSMTLAVAYRLVRNTWSPRLIAYDKRRFYPPAPGGPAWGDNAMRPPCSLASTGGLRGE